MAAILVCRYRDKLPIYGLKRGKDTTRTSQKHDKKLLPSMTRNPVYEPSPSEPSSPMENPIYEPSPSEPSSPMEVQNYTAVSIDSGK